METRGADKRTGQTFSMRTKESAMDYRFMRDPDLPPLLLDRAYVENVQRDLPELPVETAARLQRLGLNKYQIGVLMTQESTFYFDAVCASAVGVSAQKVHPWVTTELQGLLPAGTHLGMDLNDAPVSPNQLGALLLMLDKGILRGPQAKELLLLLIQPNNAGAAPAEVASAAGLMGAACPTASQLHDLCREIAVDPRNSKQLGKWRQGKQGMLRYFLGEAMRTSRGALPPAEVEAALRVVLDEV
jgi:aspartyl-tRNA(Asn)/glutamyl-tRNA(Gln) amidotransferase subunit B